MVLQWTDSQIIDLISLVKKLPPIYDKSSTDYENKDLKTKFWETTSKKLGTSSRDCRRKWTGMCLKYYKFKEDTEDSADGENWKWQEHMSFIDPDAIKKGDEIKVETSVANSSGDVVQTNGGVADKTDTVKELSKAMPNLTLEVSHVSHAIGVASLPNISQRPAESSYANVSRDVVSTTSSPSLELSNGLDKFCGGQRNVNANRMFLESLVSDLSSMSVSDQYDFKAEVLGLMRKYLQKNC
ncbi:uncharacterized protein LOC124161253 [Ischnura elegans]|uniref:uncharacterized protein LOC124161253 n=1 Tax=Ischnura elegans TaxID=197161 RepID=UPI001ED8AF96|nr:uncharacterized protein LOC124161253 [Ischnura elegans]XP_046393491.1 uncharacterized protein LOC124161253 [Ischnura elegans]